MFSQIHDRIAEALRQKCISVSSFAKNAGMIQNTVNRQIKGISLSASVIEALAKQYPDISMEWLIRGNGPMILSHTEPQPASIPNPPIGQPLPTESDALASAMELIQQQNEFIQAQAALITQLKSQLNQQ